MGVKLISSGGGSATLNIGSTTFAGIGYRYSEELDAFIPPSPFPSWVLDPETCLWNPPIPMPTDGKLYLWDEETKTYIEVKQ